jgi:hypothetical protein
MLLFFAACKAEPVMPTTTAGTTGSGVSGMANSPTIPKSAPEFELTSTRPNRDDFPFEKKPYGSGLSALPVSAKLAELTKEDGTGIISLDTPPTEVRAILRRENITFLVEIFGSVFTDDEIALDESISGLVFEDSSDYTFDAGVGLRSIYTVQTQKGLDRSIKRVAEYAGVEEFVEKTF